MITQRQIDAETITQKSVNDAMGEAWSAVLSNDARYRYLLRRVWGDDREESKLVTFVCLNPSTASGLEDDPTIRRMRGFAKSLGADGFQVVNLFAFRATDPRQLVLPEDPEGLYNQRFIRDALCESTHQIACWGSNQVLKAYPDVPRKTFNLMVNIAYRSAESMIPMCLGTNKDGEPKHPLYLKRSAEATPYSREGGPILTEGYEK